MSDRPADADCVFCSIVAGDLPSHQVAETDDAVAFLDANPLARGHTLVVPKGHYETFADVPDDELQGVFELLGGLTPAVERAVDADASNIGFNNGAASGQEIPHLHGHIVPRFRGDGGRPIHAVGGTPPDLSDDDLAGIAERIADES